MTFQFLVVEGETPVFKVFFPDRVQQCSLLLRNAFLSGLWSRSLILASSEEAFKIFAQDSVHLHLLDLQLVSMVLQMSLVKGFFRTFPDGKSAKTGPHPRSDLSADFTPSTPAACFSEDGFFYHEDDTKVWLEVETGRWKLLCSEPPVYRDDPRVPG